MSWSIAGAGLLVSAVAALGAAGLRAASLAAPQGLERGLAAAPLTVAAGVSEALALGTVGLGGSPLALAAAAWVTWLCAWRWLPRPELGIGAEVTAWVRRAPLGSRLAAAGVLGLWAGWIVWALRHPQLGLDGSTYHLSAVANWVIDGSTGHSQDLYAMIPVGSYPLSDETALAWGLGIADSFAPVAFWTASIGLLLGVASWIGLRALSVPRLLAGLAIAAFASVPVVLRGLTHAETDVPAVAWLVCTAALAACSRRRPALLAPMLVAAALAIGTKTTTLPLAGLLVAVAGWQSRASLRRLAVPLALSALLGLVAGGLWYVRDLLAHGSPLWPFVAAPWGDPVPPLFARVNYSLLERPRATLEGQWSIYRNTLSGGLVLLAGGLLSPLWAPRRTVAAGAVVTLLATLAWASAPFTGAGASPFLQVNTLRYLIPALAAAASVLALSGRYGGRRLQAWVALLLAGALAWNAKTYLDDGYLPSESALVLCVLAGTAAAAALGVFLARPRAVPAAAVPVAAALAAALLLVLGGHGYVERHADAGDLDSGVVRWFTAQPDWRSGDAPIAFSPAQIAPLAGDRPRHPLELVRPGESCAQVRARLTRGWIVVRGVDRNLFGLLPAERCLASVKPVYDDGFHRVYRG